MVFPKLLRKNYVLASIFFSSLFYFLVKTGILRAILRMSQRSEEQELELQKMSAHRRIQWYNGETPIVNTAGTDTNDLQATCRNTKQGKHFITDDRGYTCKRRNLLLNGCCDLFSFPLPSRLSCLTCSQQIPCCATFEYCVSCCLKPEQRTLLEAVVKESHGHRLRLFVAARDQFELCLQKCRTSSNSVHNENKYKNAKLKHCYGLEPILPFEDKRRK